jgi:DivIVA domain-containing protein
LFWFMLIALVAVVAAVALAVLGDGGVLPEAVPDRADTGLPDDRPLRRADIDEARLPVALRGYRMGEVDDVLDRLAAELAERDARIAELEAALEGARASAGHTLGGPAGSPPAERAGPAQPAAPDRSGGADCHRPGDQGTDRHG